MTNMQDSPHRGMLRYTSRDYNSIMQEFWDLVPKLSEIWKPEADADPGVVLGKFLASIADMLGVNLDWLANEIFAPSVTQRKNAERLFALIGYNLGWYTAARTEVTFINNSDREVRFDAGFNGANFATLTTHTDITNQPRVITYNIIPMTSTYGSRESKVTKADISPVVEMFRDRDEIVLDANGGRATRVAIEGEFRNISVSVSQIKDDKYIIRLPSQHVDVTAVWVVAHPNSQSGEILPYQFRQVASAADFDFGGKPEPRFAVMYDNYSNAYIQISSYINEMENFADNYLTVYWIDCSGVIGSVNANVLSNLQLANPKPDDPDFNEGGIVISNLSNVTETSHTYTVTGKSPETAKEAYRNSRNYINTWDSLITLPDYQRFLNRCSGVDCGVVLDCQKALEINLAIYHDGTIPTNTKNGMYITKWDFPENHDNFINWKDVLDLGFDPSEPGKFLFSTNFQVYTAMCYLIHNDFQPSVFGDGEIIPAQLEDDGLGMFLRYCPPYRLLQAIEADFKPLQSMTVKLSFGFARIFPWYAEGRIHLKKAVYQDVADNIILKVKNALSLYFSPANRSFGVMPTAMEVVDVVQSADSRIRYFDAGTLHKPLINYLNCDIRYFNPISFARYYNKPSEILSESKFTMGLSVNDNNIEVDPTWIIDKGA